MDIIKSRHGGLAIAKSDIVRARRAVETLIRRVAPQPRPLARDHGGTRADPAPGRAAVVTNIAPQPPSAPAAPAARDAAPRAEQVRNPAARRPEGVRPAPTAAALNHMLGGEVFGLRKVRGVRQVVHRYAAETRQVRPAEPHGFEAKDDPVALPNLDASEIQDGAFYIADEVLFEAAQQEGEEPVPWRALIEPLTGSILYLRAATPQPASPMAWRVWRARGRTASGRRIVRAGRTLAEFLRRLGTRLPQVAARRPMRGAAAEIETMRVGVRPERHEDGAP